MAGRKAGQEFFRSWKSAMSIMGGAMAALLLFVYVATHLAPGDAEVMAAYARLAALTPEELQAVALAADVSTEERCDAVAMLGNMGEPDEHIDRRVALLLAIRLAPDVEEQVASEAGHLADMLGMFRYLGGPSPDWVWREEDYRMLNFHDGYLRRRGRMP